MSHSNAALATVDAPAKAARGKKGGVGNDLRALDSRFAVCEQMISKSALPPAIERIARLFDGQRSVEQVLKAARISETKGLAVVKKLKTLGIIMPARRVMQTTGFSDLEEAFFNSDVGPIDECDLPFETLRERVRRLVKGGGKQDVVVKR
jgi:hypothetical protein